MRILSSSHLAWLKRKSTLHIALLILLPIILCVINDNWIFNPIPAINTKQNSLDPWMYHALFQRYPDLSLILKDPFISAPNLYYMERVGWITVGYVIYHLFTPLLANFVLHLANYYLGVFSLYFLVRHWLSSETALVTALLMGVYPWYLASVGYDYLDGYNNSLFLFALLCATLAMLKHRDILMLVAGAAFAIAISNNSTFGINAVSIAGFVLLLWWQKPPRRLLMPFRMGMIFVLGTGLMLVALGIIYYIFTGEWNYWYYTTHFSQHYSAALQSNTAIRQEIAEKSIYFINPFTLHVFPLFTALIAALTLSKAKSLSAGQVNFLGLVAILFAVTYCIWVFLSSFLLPYLQIYLYASYMMPLTFLLFAGVIHCYTEKFGFSLVYALSFVAALLIPIIYVTFSTTLNTWQFDEHFVLVLLLVAILGLTLFFIRRHPVLIFIAGCGLTILQILVTPFGSIYLDRGQGRAYFEEIQGLLDRISIGYPTGQSLTHAWGWFDSDFVKNNPDVTPISTYTNLGMGFWWGRLFNLESFFPTSAVDMVVVVEPGQNIEEIQNRIEKYDYTLTVKSVDNYVLDYPIYFTRLTPILIQDFDRRYKWFSKDIPWYGTLSADGDMVFETGPSELTTVELNLPHSDGNVLAEVCILNSYAPKFPEKLRLSFNNQPLATELATNSQNCPYLFRATIPTDTFNQAAKKQFGVATDIIILGDSFFSRSLGVVISWVRFSQK